MRVGFDTSPIAPDPGHPAPHGPFPRGIVRLVSSMIEALEARGEIDVVRLAPAPGEIPRRWRQRALPRAVREHGLAGIHSFVSAFALRGPGLRVHTVHELPWRHGVRENADMRHRFWATLGARRADRVVTATGHVARELGPGLARKVVVIPWGVGPPFAEEPPPGVVDEPVLDRYRLPQTPYALCLGAVRAKKNLAALLRGSAALRERGGPSLQLVVTGPDTPDLRRDLGLASKLGLARFVSTPGEVDEADLPALYRLASVVPVLSRSEGFGFPVLEALACGTPVVVPRASAQAEVAGELGIAVDADDPASVADGLARALAGRETLRYTLPARAREVTWDAAAARVEKLWRELAGR